MHSRDPMISTHMAHAANALKQGKLVGIPTETVYGLAANALDDRAVAGIFAAKNRPYFDPLIVHLPWFTAPTMHFGGWCDDVLHRYVMDVPPWAYALAAQFWPGPLTLVLPRRACIPDLVTSGLPTVGVRVPNHPMTLALLAQLPFPLAAPSANPFGYVSPTTPAHVAEQLAQHVDTILDGGPCIVGIESTIVGAEEGVPTIFRTGGLSQEDIESVIGPVQVRVHAGSNLVSPGQCDSHYAPRIPMTWNDGTTTLPIAPQQCAALRFSTWHPDPAIPREQQMILSATGDLHEAARNVFAALRAFDAMGTSHSIALILAERCPDTGLGRAINDRLERACRR